MLQRRTAQLLSEPLETSFWQTCRTDESVIFGQQFDSWLQFDDVVVIGGLHVLPVQPLNPQYCLIDPMAPQLLNQYTLVDPSDSLTQLR